jgi:adenine-specific DNA methylase
MSDQKRLIEVAFPRKQASLDAVHEKNVRHGHISTLHIWPARRPLAAALSAQAGGRLPWLSVLRLTRPRLLRR